MKTKAAAFVAAFVLIVGFINKDSDTNFTTGYNVATEKLSDFGIFKYPLKHLKPADDFLIYELSTTLFTDYAEKQRLIKIPAGKQITAINDNLPDFPEGTMLVKTFYYPNYVRDTSKGRKIIETRIGIRKGDGWSFATYAWNTEQTEAFLQTRGGLHDQRWLDSSGEQRAIKYQVPSAKQCLSCHRSGDGPQPIGPKLRNLNRDIMVDGRVLNQLKHWQQLGILSLAQQANIGSVPDWTKKDIAVNQRVRAYLDVNCAHCHNNGGSASHTRFRFDYALRFEETGIASNEVRIIRAMKTGRMPKLGTSVVDAEALQLITSYLHNLKK